MKLLAMRLSDKPGNVMQFVRDGRKLTQFSIGNKIYLIDTPVAKPDGICWVSEILYTGQKHPRWVASQGGYERIRLEMFWGKNWNTAIRQFVA